jgi:hypothetical protein
MGRRLKLLADDKVSADIAKLLKRSVISVKLKAHLAQSVFGPAGEEGEMTAAANPRRAEMIEWQIEPERQDESGGRFVKVFARDYSLVPTGQE